MWGTLNIEGLITEAAPKGPFGQPSMFRFVYVLCVQSFFKGIPVSASTGSIREGCKVSPALHTVGMPGCGRRRQRVASQGFGCGQHSFLILGHRSFQVSSFMMI